LPRLSLRSLSEMAGFFVKWGKESRL
jgi:hypothetical protein